MSLPVVCQNDSEMDQGTYFQIHLSPWTKAGKQCIEHAITYGQDVAQKALVFLNGKGQDLVRTFEGTEFFLNGNSLVTLAAVILVCKSICVLRRTIQTSQKKQIQRSEKEWRNSSNINGDLTSSWSVFDLAKTAYEPGHAEAVIDIVEKLHYDVNSVIPSNGLTLFLCACLSGQKGLIKYMLDKGADVKRTTKAGDTALYLATFGVLSTGEPNVTVLEDLIRSGCDINASNLAGYTPLHRAAGHGNLNVIQTLLKHALVYTIGLPLYVSTCFHSKGADPYQASCTGIYPIDSAINAGNLDAADLLKIHVPNPHVWDVIEPHTPPHIKLGLQSPQRKHLVESTRKIMSPRIM